MTFLQVIFYHYIDTFLVFYSQHWPRQTVAFEKRPWVKFFEILLKTKKKKFNKVWSSIGVHITIITPYIVLLYIKLNISLRNIMKCPVFTFISIEMIEYFQPPKVWSGHLVYYQKRKSRYVKMESNSFQKLLFIK